MNVCVEDDWTDALSAALRSSVSARQGFSDLCARVGIHVGSAWSYLAARQTRGGPGNGIPDLLAVDESGSPRLAVEVKFGAGLTPHQPTGYLAGLPAATSRGVLFIVSAKQIARLTREVADRLVGTGLLPDGDFGSLFRYHSDGSRTMELLDRCRVAFVTDDALVRALTLANTPPDLMKPLRSIGDGLTQRWRGSHNDIEHLLHAGMVVRELAEHLHVRALCDWPYAGSQRLHMLYRPEWRTAPARLPRCAVAFGWNWGTRLDGGTTGNDGVRPYVTVAVLDKDYTKLVQTTVANRRPAERRLERPSGTYPAWFYLNELRPELTSAQDLELHPALKAGWEAWSPALDAVC